MHLVAGYALPDFPVEDLAVLPDLEQLLEKLLVGLHSYCRQLHTVPTLMLVVLEFEFPEVHPLYG